MTVKLKIIKNSELREMTFKQGRHKKKIRFKKENCQAREK